MFIKPSKRQLGLVVSTSALLMSGALGGATAQEASGADKSRLGTITVTAEKRETNLQDVPLSVTAFDGGKLDKLNLQNSTDLAQFTPGLNIGTPVGEGNNPSITLRGVGLNDFNDNNEGPVAVYVDDVYISALPGLTFQLFDTQRVEVLRGPQGTLYGRNATGGLVHFVSNKPTDEFEASAKLTVASYGQTAVDGFVSGPLTDSVRGRVAAKINRAGAYVENRGPGSDSNEADSVAVRGLLDFDISENVSLLLKANYADSGVAPSPKYQHQGTGSPFGANTDIYGYSDTDGDVFAGEYDTDGNLEITTSGLSADLSVALGAIDLKSITAIMSTEKQHTEDTDVGPFPGAVPIFNADLSQFSQEFRLSGDVGNFNWIGGFYYIDTTVEANNTLDVKWRGDFANILDSDPAVFGGLLAAINGPIANTSTLVDALFFDVNYEQDTQSSAVFGQVDWQLSELVKLTGGLRYTQEDRTIEYVNGAPSGPLLNNALAAIGFDLTGTGPTGGSASEYFNFTSATAGGLNKLDSENVSGKLGIEVQPNDDLLFYGSYSQGFKSGGFNAGFLDQSDLLALTDVPYDEEILTSFEVGAKLDFADGRARVNASAFVYDYEDFQALTFQGLSQFITNANAEMTGAEIEFFAQPTERLNIQLGASVLNAEVSGVRNLNATNAADQILNGLSPVLAPEFTANGLVTYSWDAFGGDLTGSVDFSHQGEHFFDITNSANSKSDSYTLVGAGLTYTPPSEKYELSAFARNLTDEEYLVYTFDFTGPLGLNQRFYGPPRWIGVSAKYNF